MRLRARLVQECLALVGIAAGVALLFASQVASPSLQSSVAQLSRGIVGSATLQLLARDPHGFPQSMLARVRADPRRARRGAAAGSERERDRPAGSESVELVGADRASQQLGGALVRHTELDAVRRHRRGRAARAAGRTIGVTQFGQEVTFQLAGRSGAGAAVRTARRRSQIGPLVASPVAVAPLFFAQEMAGCRARVSRILVQPAAGAEARVRAALEALAAGRLNVEATGYDERLFAKAAAASNQSTALFAVISALVGFLFAFNAMLLTVPQRRRLIADLRRDGYTPRTVIAVLLLDARRARPARLRARAGARRGALDPPVSLQPRVPLARVRASARSAS